MASSSALDAKDEPTWISPKEQKEKVSTEEIEIIEVLKRKACSSPDENNEQKKPKPVDTNGLDIEFIEVHPEDDDWMTHTSDRDSFSNLPNDMPQHVQQGEEDRKGSNLLSLISIIAAKNAIVGGSTPDPDVPKDVSESLSKNHWQLHLKPEYFSSILESDVINWTGESSLADIIVKVKPSQSKQNKSKKTKSVASSWMLNPSRNICAFVHTDVVQGKPKTTYYCNFCKLTEASYGGFYQHLNHHLFVCGLCAYHSSCRLDVEIHRERAKHMTPLALGYLAHKQQDQLMDKCKRTTIAESNLLEWQTIKEETEALIIIQASFFPESAKAAHKRAYPCSEETSEDTNDTVNMVCALPYHRYVSQKSCRKNVLEYHCNFCQSTPIYTQELYRHVDFHAFSCKETDCEFQSFTNLELFLHQRNVHLDKYQNFLEKLIIFLPQSYTKEEDFVEMAVGHNSWSIVLNLPRSVTTDLSKGLEGAVLKKEREWRCKVCNNFVINKGGLTTHLVLLHNIKPKDVLLYMEPMM